jgi:hypothetical protein
MLGGLSSNTPSYRKLRLRWKLARGSSGSELKPVADIDSVLLWEKFVAFSGGTPLIGAILNDPEAVPHQRLCHRIEGVV